MTKAKTTTPIIDIRNFRMDFGGKTVVQDLTFPKWNVAKYSVY